MPLIIWAAIALASFGAVALAAWSIRRWLATNQRVAFIGRPATGKTTMLHLLEHGDIPSTGPAPTFEPEEVEVTIFGGITITVLDTGGDRLDQWEAGVKRSQGVAYFFDVSRVADSDPDTLSALDADADNIDVLLGSQRSRPHFTLVGTHSDLLADSEAAAVAKRHPVIQRLRQAAGASADDIVIGSLASKKSAVRLADALAKSQRRRP
jgi:tRNA U34 5-carboxymethylaminomethyl modifying GTPase MnmE/TrmE